MMLILYNGTDLPQSCVTVASSENDITARTTFDSISGFVTKVLYLYPYIM